MADFDRTFGDQYAVVRELGGGGMSRVFLATDTALGREIVLKYLSPEICVGLSEERFRNETRVIAKLQHPYIVPLLTAGVADNCPFYTMPYVAGESLRERIERDGALPVQMVMSVMRDVAEALCYAHERGVVHRDIKPANILLTGDHAVVTDFGVAKALSDATQPGEGLTTVGSIVGTPAYMAPEQASADPFVDHRADIYALGTVAYEMLAGRPVFHADSPRRLMAAHLTQPVEPLARHRADIPPGLAAIVMKCLEKDPTLRYQSAREVMAALDSVARPRAEATSPGARIARSKKAWLAAAILVVLLAAAALLLQPRGASARQSRLLVLPFDNLGPAADLYFAEGLADEITNRLAQLGSVEVIGRGSGARLKREGRTAQQIGDELGADYVLDGSVRWARTGTDSSRVRVTPALIRTSTGAQVWGEPYEAVLAQVFTLQANIAEQVASALKLKLEPRDVAALRVASTTDLGAFDAYLWGRHYWKQRTPESLFRAIAEFEKAIALDPKFARAHAGLGDTYAVLPVFSDSITPLESYARGAAASRRALELDPALAEAHAGLGESLYYQHDWAGAYKSLTRALELDPAYASAHQWLGELLTAVGRFDDGVVSAERATRLEPAMPVMVWMHGYALYAAGRHADAEAAFMRAHRLVPEASVPRAQLAMLYSYTGRPAEAVPYFAVTQMSPAEARAFAFIRTAEDTATVLRAARRAPNNYIAAAVYTRGGDFDNAFAALRRAIARRESPSVGLKSDPALKNLRGDPRYQELLRQTGLADDQLRAAGLLP